MCNHINIILVIVKGILMCYYNYKMPSYDKKIIYFVGFRYI